MAEKSNKILHNAWTGMKNRCYNKNSPDYPTWGGRGIRVCDRWMDYEKFLEDMESTHKKGLTLDRIDNNGNYEKSNCRWVDRAVQNRNRRDNIVIEYAGKSMPLTTWSYEVGLKSSTLRQRYYVYGWRGDKLFQPLVTTYMGGH